MHSLLEAYLEQVSAPLKFMPAAHRDAEIHELRLHLQDAVEARQAAGQDAERSLEIALREFGPPAEVGRGLRRTWVRGLLIASGETLGTSSLAFVVSVAQPILLFGVFNFDGWLHRVCPASQVGWIHLAQPCVIAAIAGLLTGIILPRRAALAAALSWTVIFLLDAALSYSQTGTPRSWAVFLSSVVAVAAAYWAARLGRRGSLLLRSKLRRSPDAHPA